MALRTFTADRPPDAGDGGGISSWHLSAGGVALVVEFCEGAAGTPIFQVQVPINTSASQSYHKPIRCPSGGEWHIEVVSGTLNRGAIDFV